MSPSAKGIRTFAAAAVGVLAAAAVWDWNAESSPAGATALGLGLAGAALAGIVAALWALADRPATTPLGKAINTLWQTLAAGLAVVAINSVADLTAFPKVAWPLGLGAVFAALQTYAQNVAEGVTLPPVSRDGGAT